ncbi:hypothetical protein [Sorangium sp. So ce1335]|uniref:hypothetical protein n=1 Tax=Sorangium sp. So ce1335 TaxID=3133335 RepID=UPI003F63243A
MGERRGGSDGDRGDTARGAGGGGALCGLACVVSHGGSAVTCGLYDDVPGSGGGGGIAPAACVVASGDAVGGWL